MIRGGRWHTARMTSSLTLRMAAALGAATLSIAALAGCGETATTATVGPDGTATLTFRDGQAYTVTMAKGQTTPVDVYGNDGGEPVSFFSASNGAADVKLGQPFAVQLPENPSTGYAWKVSGTAVGSVVEPVQEYLEPGTDESGEVGVPTQQVWVYRGTAAGTGTLVFQQFPPGNDTPSKAYTMKVTVTE